MLRGCDECRWFLSALWLHWIHIHQTAGWEITLYRLATDSKTTLKKQNSERKKHSELMKGLVKTNSRVGLWQWYVPDFVCALCGWGRSCYFLQCGRKVKWSAEKCSEGCNLATVQAQLLCDVLCGKIFENIWFENISSGKNEHLVLLFAYWSS